MSPRRHATCGWAALALLLLIGCTPADEEQPTPPTEPVTSAVAVLHPADGDSVRGIVRFTLVEGGVRVVADVQNLSPGEHGFHVHEFGDLSAGDLTSAGGHFAPLGKNHGAPADDERHAGDLGNIAVDPEGVAHYERVDTVLRLDGPRSIIGRAVIIHAQADDFQTQPTGAAGARRAGGVIGIAQ